MIKDFVTLKKDETIKECIDAMFEKHVGSVVITTAEREIEGIFTERDVIRVVSQGIPLDTPIEKVMTKNVYTVSEDAAFRDAKHIILDRKVRHLPVTDSDGKIVGLLSIRQLYEELFEM
ncbi:MAG: CBS domain-containing protein [Candidatus Bathyarchaeota archaeon]|nr:CBS domain-containing protein [Candidatus Bathyarchaeota archaeon]